MDRSTILLTEFETVYLPADRLLPVDVAPLQREYAHALRLNGPSATNGQRWQLISQGFCGHILLPSGQRIAIEPKVPVRNLFEMLALVYQLELAEFSPALSRWRSIKTMDALFELLIRRLLELIEARLRLGLYRSYVEDKGLSDVIRGRVDTAWVASHPAAGRVLTETSGLTADVWHNQIILYTLQQIVKGPLPSDLLRREINALIGRMPVPPVNFGPIVDLAERPFADLHYTPAIEDYRAMHALCHFLLELIGPQQRPGEHLYPTFLINMATLFERFVGLWLERHFGGSGLVELQRRKALNASERRFIAADIVLRDREGLPIIVLDTKYKGAAKPDLADLYQVAFYAREFDCHRSGLIYPQALSRPLNGQNRDVSYATFCFDLAQPIDQAGSDFLAQLERHIH